MNSTSTDPERKPPNIRPVLVTIGTIALRSTWTRKHPALGQALGVGGTRIVAQKGVGDRGLDNAPEHKTGHGGQRHGRQDQMPQPVERSELSTDCMPSTGSQPRLTPKMIIKIRASENEGMLIMTTENPDSA